MSGLLQWGIGHWPALALAVTLGLAVMFPAVSAPILRWLLTTQRGRYLLLATLVLGAAWWQWEARFSAGYAAAVADQARAADRTRADASERARRLEQQHAEDMAAIATRYEQEKRDATQAAYDRALADVRAGRVRLREHWRCPVPAAATPGAPAGERDDAAGLREQAAARVVRIGAEADAQLRACQAVIAADRR